MEVHRRTTFHTALLRVRGNKNCPMNSQDAGRASRNAALTLAVTLPGDTSYLLLPLHAAGGGPIAGRQPHSPVFGYHWVANFYATRPRTACLAAAAGAILSTFGYAGVVGPLAADRRPPSMGAGLCGVEHR
jgi:hypothetical protein